jgi:predicted dehydrogenase
MKKVNIAVVGLNFGANFAHCYRFHPNVGELTICDLNHDLVNQIGDRLGIRKRYFDLADVLNDPTIDAVHLLTNIPDHDKQSIAVLEADKHCACAVPMSINKDGIYNVINAQKKSGKKYMLMETIHFTRNYLYAQKMIDTGEIGHIQYIKGVHCQDMEGWPSYWKGLPPVFYASHAVAPAFVALKCDAKRVICFGTGKMREEMHKQYGNPYPVQMALYEMEDGTLAEVTRTLFYSARGFAEGFSICGDLAAFETGQINDDLPVVFKYRDNGIFDPDHIPGIGREILEQRISPPDRLDLLPMELYCFTNPHVRAGITDPSDTYLFQPGPSGGYHPHVVNAFIRYLTEEIEPFFNISNAARLTAACICAHESSMAGGKEIIIPKF